MDRASIGHSTKVIEQLKRTVKERCENSRFYSHTAGEHSLDVAEKAELLAERVGANIEICWLGGLLHDIGAVTQGPENHHKTGAEMAGKILTELGYSEDILKAVQYCIFVHRGSVEGKRETIEAKVVASADAISHFVRVSELIKVAYYSLGKNPEEAKEWTREKLKRSWHKLMPEVRTEAVAQYDAALKELNA